MLDVAYSGEQKWGWGEIRPTQRSTHNYQLGNATEWENPVLSEQTPEGPDLLVLRQGSPQEDILKEVSIYSSFTTLSGCRVPHFSWRMIGRNEQ